MIRELDPDARLVQRLSRHPQLRTRIECLLEVVENAAGEVVTADAAERRVIEELRRMGREALTAWAERGLERSAAEVASEPAVRRGGEKNSTGTRPSEKSR